MRDLCIFENLDLCHSIGRDVVFPGEMLFSKQEGSSTNILIYVRTCIRFPCAQVHIISTWMKIIRKLSEKLTGNYGYIS